MLDIATRKELAALAYERAELETDGHAHPIFIVDDGGGIPNQQNGGTCGGLSRSYGELPVFHAQ